MDTTVGNAGVNQTIASGAFNLTGIAPNILNTDSTLTGGILNETAGDATFVGANTIAFGSGVMQFGSAVTLTNGAPPPETANVTVPLPPVGSKTVATPYGGSNVPVAASTPFPAYTNTIALVPSLYIGSKIDLNGNTLTEGPSTATTSDTGFTNIIGNITSSVPTTDGIVQSGGGTLALAPVSEAACHRSSGTPSQPASSTPSPPPPRTAMSSVSR